MDKMIFFMKKPKTWITRTFDGRIDAQLLPNILSRLAGAPARAEELTGSISENQLRLKPGGKWSVLEHAGHLADLEELWLRRFEDFDEGRTVLRAWDVTNRKTETAGHNEKPVRELLADFRTQRQKLVNAIAALNDEALSHVALHPRLQRPMQAADLAHFIAEHDDHHIAVIAWLITL
jgi:uncharacterized damage-inducible protein DinB